LVAKHFSSINRLKIHVSFDQVLRLFTIAQKVDFEGCAC
jgi:hypothetical protein